MEHQPLADERGLHAPSAPMVFNPGSAVRVFRSAELSTSIALHEGLSNCPAGYVRFGAPTKSSRRKLTMVHPACCTRAFLAAVTGAFLMTPMEVTLAQTRPSLSVAESCLMANQRLSLGTRLPRTAARLKAGGPLKVVAVGS